MWIRRNNIFARNGQNNGVGPNIQSPNSTPFNPNHRRYRTCCCHSKAFTLSFGMVELFLICFILVAIGPDFNNKYCLNHHLNDTHFIQSPSPPTPENSPPPPQPAGPPPPPPSTDSNNNTNTPSEADRPMAKRRRKRQLIEENGPSGLPQSSAPDVMALIGQKSPLTEAPPNNDESPENRPVINGSEEIGKMDDQEDISVEKGTNSFSKWLKYTTCNLTVFWVVWIILHMLSIGLICYGIRRQLWLLIIPHIIFRISWILIISLIIASIISSLFTLPQNDHLLGHVILCIFLFVLCLIICLFVKSEIACILFVKRSAETGFSISNTRPFAPPSAVSNSDGNRPNEQVRKIVHTSIRKVPGPSAKRYQQENLTSTLDNQNVKKQNSVEDENNNFSQMTMTTLAAVGAGTSNNSSNSTTRPSTAGSLMQTNRSGIIKGFVGIPNSNTKNTNSSSRGSSAEERRFTPLNNLNYEMRETNFGGDGRVINGTLPPLRHTYKA
uniref:Uncharacterized protein n=1 Tax=Meloidogyne enterolobii TaxID=390850 RepID=A0A6V7WFX1_MELEN|nr:unnamed protein product [Meloidogyne enterolobii]